MGGGNFILAKASSFLVILLYQLFMPRTKDLALIELVRMAFFEQV